MKNNILLIFFTSLIFSFDAMAGPDCIYVPIDIQVTKYENVNLHIVEQECINYPKDYFHNVQKAYFVTQHLDKELLNTVIEIGQKDRRLSEDYVHTTQEAEKLGFRRSEV